MEKKNYKSPILLTITAAIWGFAFVAQSVGMEYVGPFTFICVRNLIGAAVLLPVIRLLGRRKKSSVLGERRLLFTGGGCCGVILFLSSSAQQIGIQYTTVGKAGFITAIYIILVPVFSLFLGKRCGILVWVSVVLAMIGFYFLTMVGEGGFTKGDIYVLLCAFLFSWHILCVDYFAPKVDGVKMACIQFAVCSVLSGIAMLIFEEPRLSDILQAWAPILYAGALSCGVAYTLQILGQKDFNPTVAALIMSLESVFSVLAGWLILHQALSLSEAVGCILIFAGIILAQLPKEWYHKA
jgi:drug/metabolite transporter (DMT)-like permease